MILSPFQSPPISLNMSSVYSINKGINRPITFKGLKAQYISFLAGGLVALLISFAILYIAGVHLLICLIIVFGSGAALFTAVFHLSHRYGQYGLMKRMARRGLPTCICVRSEKAFRHLKMTAGRGEVLTRERRKLCRR